MQIFNFCNALKPSSMRLSYFIFKRTKDVIVYKYTHRLSQLACFSTTDICYEEKSDASKVAKKKNVNNPYPSSYDPNDVEKDWYEYWESSGCFKPHIKSKEQKIFSMVLPPPNITGTLHLGHTLTATIQDAICRWHRMKGKAVVWIPGYDHGGIATQTVVERKIMKERQLNKHQLGKETFLAEVVKWKTNTQMSIEKQLKELGCSLDFGRTSFTMDSRSSDAVVKAFIQLFDENLIYRQRKMVNWSCAIQSVISDIEVDHLEIPGGSKLRVPGLTNPIEVGFLEYFYYPVEDSDDKIAVATTRLETMLGDVALAVNPEDPRHTHLIGKFVKHPFTNTKIPVISDETIDKDFGTGVMKVTPAHDFKDFELGLKHNLPLNEVFADDGTVMSHIDNFGGTHRFLVRDLIRNHLMDKGLFLERRNHSISIPVCSRTGDVVEPRLKHQWYLDCAAMGDLAVQAVAKGHLNFEPEYHSKLWYEWFKNLQDWCISRQLWWGHRIPAFKVIHSSIKEDADIWVAAESEIEAIKKAAEKLKVPSDAVAVIQDEDVLDTWFSSALFPLTSLGWPENTDDMDCFYPLSLMETGYDILFFWVSRMIMLGRHLSGKLPFNQVLLHGMVCDSHGRKMTKSLGNIIDPSDIIHGITLQQLLERAEDSHKQGTLSPEELRLALKSYSVTYPTGIPECGTDSLRFSLLSSDVKDQRINMDVREIRTCRHFCNKIWQGVRLFTKTIENCDSKDHLVPLSTQEVNLKDLTEVDQWILSRLARMVTNTNQSFEQSNLHSATAAMRQFWVQNFCDIYLEYAKQALLSADDSYRLFLCRIILTCIDTFLHIISPVMPFLSEELYQRLSFLTNLKQLDSITTDDYPDAASYSPWRNTVLEADINTVMDLVNVARSLKMQHGATKMRPKVTIAVDNEETLSALSRFGSLITTLARLDSVTFHVTQGQEFFEQRAQDSWVFREHQHGISMIMEIDDQLLYSKGSENRVESIRQELNKLTKMISDTGYRKKAPLSVQEKHLAKKASLEAELQKSLAQYGKSEADQKDRTSISKNRS